MIGVGLSVAVVLLAALLGAGLIRAAAAPTCWCNAAEVEDDDREQVAS